MKEKRMCKMYFDDILTTIDRIFEYTDDYLILSYNL
jgi:uncharacterized protein with HEPN domain